MGTEIGTILCIPKGDANNMEDSLLVPAQNLVGVYRSRIPGAGNIAMFMRTIQGLLLCVVRPILLLLWRYRLPARWTPEDVFHCAEWSSPLPDLRFFPPLWYTDAGGALPPRPSHLVEEIRFARGAVCEGA